MAIPKELLYLKDYYPVADKSPFSTFDRYYHFGKPFDAIEQEIAEIRPDVVGISSLFTPYFREVLEIAARVKKHLDIPVVVGGSHASAVPESMLASPSVDYVIRGEGEKPLVELLRYLRGENGIASVPNLSYKRNGRHCSNPMGENFPIDELPFPDLSDTSAVGIPVCRQTDDLHDYARAVARTSVLSVRCTPLSARIIAGVHWKTCLKKSSSAISKVIA